MVGDIIGVDSEILLLNLTAIKLPIFYVQFSLLHKKGSFSQKIKCTNARTESSPFPIMCLYASSTKHEVHHYYVFAFQN